MRVVSSPEADAMIAENGGRLFVWPRRGRCCGPITLDAATSAPPRRQWRQVTDSGPFAVYVPEHFARLPNELHVEVSCRLRHLRAYWDGCVWIV